MDDAIGLLTLGGGICAGYSPHLCIQRYGIACAFSGISVCLSRPCWTDVVAHEGIIRKCGCMGQTCEGFNHFGALFLRGRLGDGPGLSATQFFCRFGWAIRYCLYRLGMPWFHDGLRGWSCEGPLYHQD